MQSLSDATLICPKCRATKAVILSPENAIDPTLRFHCAGCGFEWISAAPQPLQEPSTIDPDA